MPDPQPARATDGRRFVSAMRWVLFVLLLVAAGAALVGLPRVVDRGGSAVTRLAPVALLALFIGGYAAYRFALVRAGRYPAGKALVQLAVMLLALGVIGGIALDRPATPPSGLPLAGALEASDPVARALAAELVRYRPRQEAAPLVPRLVDLLGDPDERVRSAAHGTLVALRGEDRGEGPGAVEAWRSAVGGRAER
jgi:hypothetical protein